MNIDPTYYAAIEASDAADDLARRFPTAANRAAARAARLAYLAAREDHALRTLGH